MLTQLWKRRIVLKNIEKILRNYSQLCDKVVSVRPALLLHSKLTLVHAFYFYWNTNCLYRLFFSYIDFFQPGYFLKEVQSVFIIEDNLKLGESSRCKSLNGRMTRLNVWDDLVCSYTSYFVIYFEKKHETNSTKKKKLREVREHLELMEVIKAMLICQTHLSVKQVWSRYRMFAYIGKCEDYLIAYLFYTQCTTTFGKEVPWIGNACEIFDCLTYFAALKKIQ